MRTLQSLMIVVMVCVVVACTSVQSARVEESSSTGGALSSIPPEKTVTIPAGSRLRVALLDGISTTESTPGDSFEASLVEPVAVDGKTVLQKGTVLKGRVAEVEESGRVKGRASLRLILDSVVLHGDAISIDAKPFVAVADATKTRDAAIVGGGAGIGAAVGAIAGGKKGAGVGALIGGGAGTGTVLATKGKDLHYPPETRLNFTLASSLQIPG